MNHHFLGASSIIARSKFIGPVVIFLCVLVMSADAQSNLIVTVRHAPSLNGRVEGSVQQLLGESVTLNSGFVMTGDLIVPGTPNIIINGSPSFAGVIVGTGSTSPTGYYVTLNGGVSLQYLRTRSNAVSLPTVTAPPSPAGTRSVTINAAGQSIGGSSSCTAGSEWQATWNSYENRPGRVGIIRRPALHRIR